jgi:hypothetical protein
MVRKKLHHGRSQTSWIETQGTHQPNTTRKKPTPFLLSMRPSSSP